MNIAEAALVVRRMHAIVCWELSDSLPYQCPDRGQEQPELQLFVTFCLQCAT